MIDPPKILEKDLEIFKGKKVCLYTIRGKNHWPVYKILKNFNIDVVGYTVFSKHVQPTMKQLLRWRLKGLPYISSDKFYSFCEKSTNLLIQPVAFAPEDSKNIEQYLNEFSVEKSTLHSSEIIFSFLYSCELLELKSSVKYFIRKAKNHFAVFDKYNRWTERRACPVINENTIVVCSPPKVADYTLNCTFDLLIADLKSNQQDSVQYLNLWHEPKYIDYTAPIQPEKRIRIITGIREPISQNLSVLYQRLSNVISINNLFYAELFETSPAPSRKTLIKIYEDLFKDGISVQMYWNRLANLYVNEKANKPYKVGFIQNFIAEFKRCILDITAYPFDQEKGYTIIKEGNIEVFVYQLEKLNNLIPELSEWVGVPFDKLENSNQASDKWIADSYKKAQKELEITQEYFDKCFDEPYVKHCYSEADIEKFKARWRSHISK